MYVRKFIITFVICYTIILVNKINPCIGEVFANASVTVDGDTATLTLTASVNGTFHCKLDVGSFQACYSGDTFHNLSAGLHSIAVQFTPDGSSQVILLPSLLNFNILSATVCKSPDNLTNGSFNVLFENNKTLDIGTVIQYTCHQGFRLVGSIEHVCQPNGEWNGTMPVCQPICQNCESPGIPNHGSVTLYNTTAGCEAVYECDSGYKLVGNVTYVCQPNGKWSKMEPTCERIDCGNPDQLSNGIATFVDTFFKSLVFYQCNYGFKLIGDEFLLCDATGTWSGVSPSCQLLDCGPLAIQTNTSAVYTTTIVNSTVVYYCNSSLLSHILCASGICSPNGSWEVQSCISAVVNMSHTEYSVIEDNGHVKITVLLDHPRCITTVGTVVPQLRTPVDAARSDFDSTPIPFEISPGNTSTDVFIPIINNIRVERNESFDVVLQSNSDDVIVGTPRQATVTIIDDNVISVSFRRPLYAIRNRRVKVCLTKTGRHGFPITVVLHNLNSEGSIISRNSLIFEAGESRQCYRQSAIGDKTSFNITIVPSKHVRIGDHGSTQIVVSELVPITCGVYGCKVPGKPANGMRSFQSTAIGSTVMYTCDDGFKLVGDKSRSCLDTGLWNGSVPACNCGVEGQQYLPCVGDPTTDCERKCNDPDNLVIDFCLGCQICRCPSGTVLDEIANRCVKINECTKNP